MNPFHFSELLQALAEPYARRMSSGPGDAREALALADLYIRVGYTLGIAESRAGGGRPLRVVPAPGVGTMLATLRGVQRWVVSNGERWMRAKIRKSAADLLAAVESGSPSFKDLRDRFSHGHALPADDDAAGTIAAALRGLCDSLRDFA